MGDDLCEKVLTEGFADIEAELGEFERDVAIEMFGCDTIKYSEIRFGCAARFCFACDAFAEAIEAAGAAARIEFADSGNGVIERFARNEAASHATAGTIVHDEMSHARTARQFEQDRAQHQQRLRLHVLKNEIWGGQ